jgi:hypothetical protein
MEDEIEYEKTEIDIFLEHVPIKKWYQCTIL